MYLHFVSLQSMAEQLAENYHNTWGRKKKMELQAKGMMSLFMRIALTPLNCQILCGESNFW